MARQGPTIAEAALALIHEHGPLTLDELVPALVAAGRTRARNPRSSVRNAIDIDAAFLEGFGGRWFSLADQLEGAVFTTRLTRMERQEELVLVREDLALVEQLALHGRPLVGGGAVHLDILGDYFELPWWDDAVVGRGLRQAIGDETAGTLLGFLDELGATGDEDELLRELLYETRHTRVVHGPPGWLPVLGPRQMLGIRFAGGAFDAMALDRRTLTGIHVEVAATRVARVALDLLDLELGYSDPPVIALRDLLEVVATEIPEILRRPLPPFTEVVRRGGLEVEDGLVGHAGTDWAQVRWVESPDPEDAWGFEPPSVVH